MNINLFYCALAWSETCLFFGFFLQRVENYPLHDLTGMTYQVYSSVILAFLEVPFLGEGDD